MQVAGSASGTHKHDGDNTTECFKIIFCGCCVRHKLAGGLKARDIILEGEKQDSFFYEKDKNRIAKMELVIIYKGQFQSI